jgi:uncharacterized protein with FMN-binding domain
MLIFSLTACTEEVVEPETFTGVGEGFVENIKVEVTKQGDEITAVEVLEHNETDGIGTPAIEQIPAAIVEANSTDVDLVAGATYTSEGLIYAVNNALDPENYPAPEEDESTVSDPITTGEAYLGFGLSNLGRVGPGSDDTGTQVYSINQVFANTIFDSEGKILALYVDQLEVATPNYDGSGMPHFSGFPGQGGYNLDSDHDEVVDGMTEDTEENFLSEIQGWETKRDRGSSYAMSATGTWAEQMDAFQEVFVGKTVEEVEEWFEKYTSDVNGRPLKADSSREEDVEKYNQLSEEEQEMLVDVTAGATMSLNDSHGNIIAAIKNSYENRVALDIEAAAQHGFGLSNLGRVGPGSDDTGTQVYSINQVFANTLLDEEGKIAAIYVDQLEVATPNYDGSGMPHFSGFPGQGGYNLDSDHDEVVDSMTEDTEENFLAEIQGWETKRDRGSSYVMSAIGTWSDQMNAFQEVFIGMTAEEVQEWFEKYTSDVNGRPLKADSSREEDVEKYNQLSEEEQEMLVDVTAGATMSLNDSHGDIIAAIVNSIENAYDIELTIE